MAEMVAPVEEREKYSQDERDKMAESGEAMADGSFPIADLEDLENAIHAVGRGGADHDKIRAHIVKRAHALDHADLIPENWQADGSLKEENSAARRRKPRHRSVPLLPEVRLRSAEGLEVREADRSGDVVEISGAPIVYNADYVVRDAFGEFTERMRPGVASDVLEACDCRFLFNHDGLPLARTLSGTLSLEDTVEALRFSARLDLRQQLANDLIVAIERGDVSQMSCGFIVARDEWDDRMEDRTIHRLDSLLDVSAVTYPASPTTSIEIAKRMVFATPVESRARLRKLAVDLRAGKVLSKANQDKAVAALSALHDLIESSGDDPNELLAASKADQPGSTDDDGSQGGTSAGGSGNPNWSNDGSGIVGRAAPATREERADAVESYNDKFRAAYDALVCVYGDNDGDCDLWVCDMGDDWIVWESWMAPMGTWKSSYTETDSDITVTGDPVKVEQHTTYVEVPAEPEPAVPVAHRRNSRAMYRARLDAQRRRPVAA